MSTAADPGLAPLRRRLRNGLAILAQSTGTHPAVTLALTVPAGAVSDPEDRTGLAHFVSRLIDRGTASRSSTEIAEALDDRGVTLTTGVNRHLAVVNCSCLTDDAPSLIELMGEIAREPVFPPSEVETRRAEIVTAIRQDDDNPANVAAEAGR